MARISRRQLSEQVLEKLFELFFEVVGNKNTKEEFKETIIDLLSPVERIMIAKRVAIIYLLLKKIDQRTISKVLKVSNATVSKFAIIMEKSRGIVPTFSKILRNEKIVDFLEEIFNILLGPGVYGTNWKAGWERRKERYRKKRYGM